MSILGFNVGRMHGGKRDTAGNAIDQYMSMHDGTARSEQQRKEDYTTMVNHYYTLATEFYEYGWGTSFHFASRYKGETHEESLKRHEHYLGLKLGVGDGARVLDVGCGIGGPLREICRFTGAKITGLNNNDHQIARGSELNARAGPYVESRCDYVKADFMKMPFEEATFDAVYAIEATCHAPSAVGVYKEIFRVLKPGQRFAAYEWCMTDRFDPSNAQHQRVKQDIEIGNGLPDIRTCKEVAKAMQQAGFEVLETSDLAELSEIPWYAPLDPSRISWTSFRTTGLGRLITRNVVWILELLRIAPAGSSKVSGILETGADALVKGAKEDLFTPMFFVLGQKPPVSGKRNGRS